MPIGSIGGLESSGEGIVGKLRMHGKNTRS